MNFGKGIFIAFILFAALMASLVTICVRQNISLVSKDYYQEELKHQVKINRQINALELEHRPTLTFTNGELIVDFDQFDQLESGEITVLRPSDPNLDAHFILQNSADARQSFKLSKWQSGLYRISLSWKVKDKEYFMEHVMVL